MQRISKRVNGKPVKGYLIDGVFYLNLKEAGLQRRTRSDRLGPSSLSIKENRRLSTSRNCHKRYRAKQKRVPSWYGEWDDLVLAEAFELAKLRELETGMKWDVDHMIPLQAQEASGLHCAENIQVIPARMNRQKNSRMELTQRLEWLTN